MNFAGIIVIISALLCAASISFALLGTIQGMARFLIFLFGLIGLAAANALPLHEENAGTDPVSTAKAIEQAEAKACEERTTKQGDASAGKPIDATGPAEPGAKADGNDASLSALPTSPVALNEGRWVTRPAYPRSDERAGVQGQVGFSVVVGVNGRVMSCKVTSSSGSSSLDSATCPLIQRRAKFQPALCNGQPVEGTYSSTVTWVIQ